MVLSSLAASAQRLAEPYMVDACTITRASADPTITTPTTVYSGKCRIRTKARSRQSAVPSDAGTSIEEDRIEVHIPVSTVGVKFNDKVTVDSSINPTLEDDTYYVAGLLVQSAASAQRLTCERRIR